MFSTKAKIDDETLNLLIKKLSFDPVYFNRSAFFDCTLYPDKGSSRPALLKAIGANNFHNFEKMFSKIDRDDLKQNFQDGMNLEDWILASGTSMHNNDMANRVYELLCPM
ncbi:MAG: hypothetical protein HRT47_07265 [Candidatus Caenarcaniphilales bacterium]|nr:hypothetical protein [Candidatus Caenarcaniphilales bacterium]